MIRKYLPVILLDEEDEDEPIPQVKPRVESSSETDDEDDLDPEFLSTLYTSVVALDERLRNIEGMKFDVPQFEADQPTEKSLVAITSKLSELSSRIDDLADQAPERDSDEP
jgi:hypothetical protein